MNKKEEFDAYSIKPRKRFMLKIMSDLLEARIMERNNPNSSSEEFGIGIKIKPFREYPKYDINRNKER